MKRIIAAILLSASAPAMAKCIYVHQSISGMVSDSSGKPIEGAAIRVVWLERGEKRSELETSDAHGHFEVHFIFNAYSGAGPLGQDRCEGKLESFEVSASKEQFQSLSRVFRASEKPVAVSLTLTKVNG